MSERITKPQARKLFLKGEIIYIQSSKMQPVNPWQPAQEFKYEPTGYDTNEGNPLLKDRYFENYLNSFKYYNCDKERGKGIHFYKSIN